MTDDLIGVACPFCGHHTLYKPRGWVAGEPVVCLNPFCDSNHPPHEEEQA